MKLAIILILFSTAAFTCLGQLKFYYPNGDPYKRACKNINDINKDFPFPVKADIPVKDDPMTVFGYKLFTSEVVWVLTDNPAKLDTYPIIDLSDYFNSWRFESDIETFISRKSLTDIYLLESLGAPDQRNKYFDANMSFENWHYDRLGLKLTIRGGIVNSYSKVDY